jgi:hypothetical protein
VVPVRRANTKEKINRIRKIKKRILAIWVATLAIPLKPKIPEMIAMIKNMIAHVNIVKYSFV